MYIYVCLSVYQKVLIKGEVAANQTKMSLVLYGNLPDSSSLTTASPDTVTLKLVRHALDIQQILWIFLEQ